MNNKAINVRAFSLAPQDIAPVRVVKTIKFIPYDWILIGEYFSYELYFYFQAENYTQKSPLVISNKFVYCVWKFCCGLFIMQTI